jgi:hypothetical protein
VPFNVTIGAVVSCTVTTATWLVIELPNALVTTTTYDPAIAPVMLLKHNVEFVASVMAVPEVFGVYH